MVQFISTFVVLGGVVGASGAVFDFGLQGSATSGLSYANEPANPQRAVSSGIGTAVGPIQYDNSSQQLSFTINFSGLAGNTTGAALRFGNVDNSNSGSIIPGTQIYNLTPYVNGLGSTSGSIVSSSSGINGALTLSPNPIPNYTVQQQEADLSAGNWYIELATDVNGMGEIRGNLTPVPEPATYAAFTGLALAGFAICRKIRAA